jgi:ABC-type methionine transport system permease subunit
MRISTNKANFFANVVTLVSFYFDNGINKLCILANSCFVLLFHRASFSEILMIILSPFTKSKVVSASAIVIESVLNSNLSAIFFIRKLIASALSLAEKLPNLLDTKSVSLKNQLPDSL